MNYWSETCARKSCQSVLVAGRKLQGLQVAKMGSSKGLAVDCIWKQTARKANCVHRGGFSSSLTGCAVSRWATDSHALSRCFSVRHLPIRFFKGPWVSYTVFAYTHFCGCSICLHCLSTRLLHVAVGHNGHRFTSVGCSCLMATDFSSCARLWPSFSHLWDSSCYYSYFFWTQLYVFLFCATVADNLHRQHACVQRLGTHSMVGYSLATPQGFFFFFFFFFN